MKMDTTFYPEEEHHIKRKLQPSASYMQRENMMNNDDRENVKRLKRNMTLDFNMSAKKTKTAQLLGSPDLHMLKLASPELERMIIAANGMVTTTPTPTQFVFPKFVTEEQEAYARGFVDALAELHNGENTNDGEEPSRPNEHPVSSVSAAYSSLSAGRLLTATTSLPGGVVNAAPAYPSLASAKTAPLQEQASALHGGVRVPRLKEEPQTVPCLSVSPPPVSPIDMESQERIKLERKRARNRVAARKCRTRKLERIARLEDKVDALKGQNSELNKTASALRDQVCKLKKQIIEHVNSGCQIMLSGGLQV